MGLLILHHVVRGLSGLHIGNAGNCALTLIVDAAHLHLRLLIIIYGDIVQVLRRHRQVLALGVTTFVNVHRVTAWTFVRIIRSHRAMSGTVWMDQVRERISLELIIQLLIPLLRNRMVSTHPDFLWRRCFQSQVNAPHYCS